MRETYLIISVLPNSFHPPLLDLSSTNMITIGSDLLLISKSASFLVLGKNLNLKESLKKYLHTCNEKKVQLE